MEEIKSALRECFRKDLGCKSRASRPHRWWEKRIRSRSQVTRKAPLTATGPMEHQERQREEFGEIMESPQTTTRLQTSDQPSEKQTTNSQEEPQLSIGSPRQWFVPERERDYAPSPAQLVYGANGKHHMVACLAMTSDLSGKLQKMLNIRRNLAVVEKEIGEATDLMERMDADVRALDAEMQYHEINRQIGVYETEFSDIYQRREDDLNQQINQDVRGRSLAATHLTNLRRDMNTLNAAQAREWEGIGAVLEDVYVKARLHEPSRPQRSRSHSLSEQLSVASQEADANEDSVGTTTLDVFDGQPLQVDPESAEYPIEMAVSAYRKAWLKLHELEENLENFRWTYHDTWEEYLREHNGHPEDALEAEFNVWFLREQGRIARSVGRAEESLDHAHSIAVGYGAGYSELATDVMYNQHRLDEEDWEERGYDEDFILYWMSRSRGPDWRDKILQWVEDCDPGTGAGGKKRLHRPCRKFQARYKTLWYYKHTYEGPDDMWDTLSAKDGEDRRKIDKWRCQMAAIRKELGPTRRTVGSRCKALKQKFQWA